MTKEDCLALLKTAEMSSEDCERLCSWLKDRQPQDELSEEEEPVRTNRAEPADEADLSEA